MKRTDSTVGAVLNNPITLVEMDEIMEHIVSGWWVHLLGIMVNHS
jgi:hypothetical protein